MIHLILVTVAILSTFTFPHADPTHVATHIAYGGPHAWSYGSGVHSWSRNYPACGGLSQSPIALHESKALKYSMSNLKWGNMDTVPVYMDLVKTDHTVMLKGIWHKNEVPYIMVNFPKEKFVLDEVHWHWGYEAHDGTEHEVNGRKGALEMHMVYSKSYGIGTTTRLVYAHLFQHKESSSIPQGLKTVAKYLIKGTFFPWLKFLKFRLLVNFKAGDLFYPPPSKVFFYRGSLTAPPCTEPVLWLVGAKMGDVGDNQINAFRSVTNGLGRKLAGNIRPLKPLNLRLYKLYQ